LFEPIIIFWFVKDTPRSFEQKVRKKNRVYIVMDKSLERKEK